MKNILNNIWIYCLLSNVCSSNILTQRLNCKNYYPKNFHYFNDKNGFKRFSSVPIQENGQQNIFYPFQTETTLKTKHSRDIYSQNGIAGSSNPEQYRSKYYWNSFNNGLAPEHQNFGGDIEKMWYSLPNVLNLQGYSERCYQSHYFMVPYYNGQGPIIICKSCGTAYVPYNNNYFLDKPQTYIQHIKIHDIPSFNFHYVKTNTYDLKATFGLEIYAIQLIPNYLSVVLSLHKEILYPFGKQCIGITQPLLINIPLFNNNDFERVAADEISLDADIKRTVKHLLYLFRVQDKSTYMPCFPGTGWHTLAQSAPASFYQTLENLSQQYSNSFRYSYLQKYLLNKIKSSTETPEISEISLANPDFSPLQGKFGLTYLRDFAPQPLIRDNNQKPRCIPKLDFLFKPPNGFSLNREGVPWSPARSFLKPQICRPEDRPQIFLIQTSPSETLGDLTPKVQYCWPLQYSSLCKGPDGLYLKVMPFEKKSTNILPSENRISLPEFSWQQLLPAISEAPRSSQSTTMPKICSSEENIPSTGQIFSILASNTQIHNQNTAQLLNYLPKQSQFDIIPKIPRYFSQIPLCPSSLQNAEELATAKLPVQEKPLAYNMPYYLPSKHSSAGHQIPILSNFEIYKLLNLHSVTNGIPSTQQFPSPSTDEAKCFLPPKNNEATPYLVSLSQDSLVSKHLDNTDVIGPERAPKVQNGLWLPITGMAPDSTQTFGMTCNKPTTELASRTQPGAQITQCKPSIRFPNMDAQILSLGLPKKETIPLSEQAITPFETVRPYSLNSVPNAEQTSIPKFSGVTVPIYKSNQATGDNITQQRPPTTPGSKMNTLNQLNQTPPANSIFRPWKTQGVTGDKSSLWPLSPRVRGYEDKYIPYRPWWNKIKNQETPLMPANLSEDQILTLKPKADASEVQIGTLGPYAAVQPSTLQAQTASVWPNQLSDTTPMQLVTLPRAKNIEVQILPNNLSNLPKSYDTVEIQSVPSYPMTPAAQALTEGRNEFSGDDINLFKPDKTRGALDTLLSSPKNLEAKNINTNPCTQIKSNELSKAQNIPIRDMAPKVHATTLWPRRVSSATNIAPIITAFKIPMKSNTPLITKKENLKPQMISVWLCTSQQPKSSMDESKFYEASNARITPLKNHSASTFQKTPVCLTSQSKPASVTSFKAFTQEQPTAQRSQLSPLIPKSSRAQILPRKSRFYPRRPQMLNFHQGSLNTELRPTQKSSKSYVSEFKPCTRFQSEITGNEIPHLISRSQVKQKPPELKQKLLTPQFEIQTLDSGKFRQHSPENTGVAEAQTIPLTSNRIIPLRPQYTQVSQTSLFKPCTQNRPENQATQTRLFRQVPQFQLAQKPCETPRSPVRYEAQMKQQKLLQPYLGPKPKINSAKFTLLTQPETTAAQIAPANAHKPEIGRQATLPSYSLPKAIAFQSPPFKSPKAPALELTPSKPLASGIGLTPLGPSIPHYLDVFTSQLTPRTSAAQVLILKPHFKKDQMSPFWSNSLVEPDVCQPQTIPLRPHKVSEAPISVVQMNLNEAPSTTIADLRPCSSHIPEVSNQLTVPTPADSAAQIAQLNPNGAPPREMTVSQERVLPEVSVSQNTPLSSAETTAPVVRPLKSPHNPEVLQSHITTLRSPAAAEAKIKAASYEALISQKVPLLPFTWPRVSASPLLPLEASGIRPLNPINASKIPNTPLWPYPDQQSGNLGGQITSSIIPNVSVLQKDSANPRETQRIEVPPFRLLSLPEVLNYQKTPLKSLTLPVAQVVTLKPLLTSKPKALRPQIRPFMPPNARIKQLKSYDAQTRQRLPLPAHAMSENIVSQIKPTAASAAQRIHLQPCSALKLKVPITKMTPNIIPDEALQEQIADKGPKIQITQFNPYNAPTPAVSRVIPLRSPVKSGVPLKPLRLYERQMDQETHLAHNLGLVDSKPPTSLVTDTQVTPLNPFKMQTRPVSSLQPRLLPKDSAAQILPKRSSQSSGAQTRPLRPCDAKIQQISSLRPCALPEVSASQITTSKPTQRLVSQIRQLNPYKMQTRQASSLQPRLLPKVSTTQILPKRSSESSSAQIWPCNAKIQQILSLRPTALPEGSASQITTLKPPHGRASHIVLPNIYQVNTKSLQKKLRPDVLASQITSLKPIQRPLSQITTLKPYQVLVPQIKESEAQNPLFRSNQASGALMIPLEPREVAGPELSSLQRFSPSKPKVLQTHYSNLKSFFRPTPKMTQLKPNKMQTEEVSRVLPKISVSQIKPIMSPNIKAANLVQRMPYKAQTELNTSLLPRILPKVSTSMIKTAKKTQGSESQITTLKPYQEQTEQVTPFPPCLQHKPEVFTSQLTPKRLAAQLSLLNPHAVQETSTNSLVKPDVCKPQITPLGIHEVPLAQITPIQSDKGPRIQTAEFRPYSSHKASRPQFTLSTPLANSAAQILQVKPFGAQASEMTPLQLRLLPNLSASTSKIGLPKSLAETVAQVQQLQSYRTPKSSKPQVIDITLSAVEKAQTAPIKLNGPKITQETLLKQGIPIGPNLLKANITPLKTNENWAYKPQTASRVQINLIRPYSPEVSVNQVAPPIVQISTLRQQNGPRSQRSMPYSLLGPMALQRYNTPLTKPHSTQALKMWPQAFDLCPEEVSWSQICQSRPHMTAKDSVNPLSPLSRTRKKDGSFIAQTTPSTTLKDTQIAISLTLKPNTAKLSEKTPGLLKKISSHTLYSKKNLPCEASFLTMPFIASSSNILGRANLELGLTRQPSSKAVILSPRSTFSPSRQIPPQITTAPQISAKTSNIPGVVSPFGPISPGHTYKPLFSTSPGQREQTPAEIYISSLAPVNPPKVSLRKILPIGIKNLLSTQFSIGQTPQKNPILPKVSVTSSMLRLGQVSPVKTYSPTLSPLRHILPKMTTATDASISPVNNFSAVPLSRPVIPATTYSPLSSVLPGMQTIPKITSSLDTNVNSLFEVSPLKKTTPLYLSLINKSPELHTISVTPDTYAIESPVKINSPLSTQFSIRQITPTTAPKVAANPITDFSNMPTFEQESPVNAYSPLSYIKIPPKLNTAPDSPVNSITFVSPRHFPYDSSHSSLPKIQYHPASSPLQSGFLFDKKILEQRPISPRVSKQPSCLSEAPFKIVLSQKKANSQPKVKTFDLPNTRYLSINNKPNISSTTQNPVIFNVPSSGNLPDIKPLRTPYNYYSKPCQPIGFKRPNKPAAVSTLSENAPLSIWNLPRNYQCNYSTNNGAGLVPYYNFKILKTPTYKKYLDDILKNVLPETVLYSNIPISIPLNEIFAYAIKPKTYYKTVPIHINGISLYICKGHTKILKPKIVYEIEDIPTTYYTIKCPPNSIYAKPFMRNYILDNAKTFIRHKYYAEPAIISDFCDNKKLRIFLNSDGVRKCIDKNGNCHFLSPQINCLTEG